jgi:hypothetical protein
MEDKQMDLNDAAKMAIKKIVNGNKRYDGCVCGGLNHIDNMAYLECPVHNPAIDDAYVNPNGIDCLCPINSLLEIEPNVWGCPTCPSLYRQISNGPDDYDWERIEE